MNVVKQKNTQRKGLYIIALFLIVSLVFNGVLLKNMNDQKSILEEEYNLQLEEKNTNIVNLEETIQDLEFEISNSTPEKRDELSQTMLEKQNEYLSIADEFISSYLNYDTNTLNQRREKLIPITTESLINQVAPESTDNEGALSSDPTFSSEIDNLTLYLSNLSDGGNEGEIIADVSYKAKSSEGETTIKSFIKLQIQTDESGTMKVSNYVYYPIY